MYFITSDKISDKKLKFKGYCLTKNIKFYIYAHANCIL